jgi:hypothetical protein
VKRKILISSFLKPVDDIRSYEKIAKSLAKNKSYSIYCLGYPSNIELSDKKIHQLPLSSFKKNTMDRILARWQVFKLYLKVKPQLIIVNSSELLLFTVLYKILFGSKIVYDIRENYFNNLWFQKNYLWGLRHVLAIVVRVKEIITALLFDHFLLAEKIYAKQLTFTKSSFTIVENKSLVPDKTSSFTQYKDVSKFIISGTIAKEYGVIEGINFFLSLESKLSKLELLIIGHCPNKSFRSQLNLIKKNHPSINLKLSHNPLPHTVIEYEIFQAQIGLLPYQPNKSTEGKWPTKIFEYMTYKLPFVIQENLVWGEFVEKHHAGHNFDFVNQSNQSISNFWQSLRLNSIKTNEHIPEIYWSNEEPKILKVVDNLLSK